MFLGVGDVDEGSCNCLSSHLFTPFLSILTSSEARIPPIHISSHSITHSFQLMRGDGRSWWECEHCLMLSCEVCVSRTSYEPI